MPAGAMINDPHQHSQSSKSQKTVVAEEGPPSSGEFLPTKQVTYKRQGTESVRMSDESFSDRFERNVHKHYGKIALGILVLAASYVWDNNEEQNRAIQKLQVISAVQVEKIAAISDKIDTLSHMLQERTAKK